MKPNYGRLLLWVFLFYFFFTELIDIAQDGLLDTLQSWTKFKSVMLSLSSMLVFFLYALGTYLSLFWTHKKPWLLKAGLMFINVIVVMAYRYFQEEIAFPVIFGFDNYHDGVTWINYFWDNLYYAIEFTALGIVFYFVQYSQFKETQRQELQIQNQKTELAFLRSQMNPHFLFNTLNNIYTLVYQKSDRALEAMDKLTSLLRYALYEPAEKVPLKKELEYITDFINLQLMRYDFTAQLQLKVEEEVTTLLIPPFSFIAFVENAFKHGDLNNKEVPLLIKFTKDEEHFIFQIENAKRQQQKDQMGGIGLGNIKKRLALIYNNQHTLDIEETEHLFKVQLKIPLFLC